MPDDASQIDAIVADDDTLYQSTLDLTAALKAAQAANPTSNFVTPDLQVKLDAATAVIAARQAAASTPAAAASPTPAPSAS